MIWSMNRIPIHLDDRQIAALDRLASDEGVSRTEVIRRLLDRVLFGTDLDLAADIAAINGSFGAMGADDLDLDALHRDDGERGRRLSRIWATGIQGEQHP